MEQGKLPTSPQEAPVATPIKPNLLSDIVSMASATQDIAVLSQLFGAKTWDDDPNWDDCVFPNEQKIVKEKILPQDPECEYFRVAGETFLFCGKDFEGEPGEKPKGHHDQVYQRHIGVAEAQLSCIDNCEGCVVYQGAMKKWQD